MFGGGGESFLFAHFPSEGEDGEVLLLTFTSFHLNAGEKKGPATSVKENAKKEPPTQPRPASTSSSDAAEGDVDMAALDRRIKAVLGGR